MNSIQGLPHHPDILRKSPLTTHPKYQSAGRSTESTLQALQNSEERFLKLIEQSPDGFFAHDLVGCILQVNEQACKLTGYSRRELLSMTVRDIQRGLSQEQSEAIWQKILSGETVVVEDELLHKDGTTFPVEVRATMLQSGDETEIIGFVSDTTQRVRREAEKEALIVRLQKALDQVKQLSGLLPICTNCHKIRDDKGYWNRLETYIQDHADVSFSHGICPDCIEKLYPDLDIFK